MRCVRNQFEIARARYLIIGHHDHWAIMTKQRQAFHSKWEPRCKLASRLVSLPFFILSAFHNVYHTTSPSSLTACSRGACNLFNLSI